MTTDLSVMPLIWCAWVCTCMFTCWILTSPGGQQKSIRALLKSTFSLIYRQLRYRLAETTNSAPNGPACDVLMLLCLVWFPSKIMKLHPLVSALKAKSHFGDAWEAQSNLQTEMTFKLKEGVMTLTVTVHIKTLLWSVKTIGLLIWPLAANSDAASNAQEK